MIDDEFEDYDSLPSFEGPCTCDHEREQHGWGHCKVEDCDCEAGWWE